METIPLGSTGRTTTRLGFGCSSLMGALSRRQSLAVLEAAYDAGVRHFDSAPMYGYGESESCLGEFLGRHRGEITVTTKFGIPAPKNKLIVSVGRPIIGPVVRRVPRFKKALQGVIQSSKKPVSPKEVSRVANPIFTADRAQASLHSSLAALKTDHIDLWLLHDVSSVDLATDSRNDSLLRVLEDAVSDGKVGAFGVGTDRGCIPDLISAHPEYCSIIQYEWSVLNPAIQPTLYFRIHHRALSEHFQSLLGLLKSQGAETKHWSEEIGADLASPGTLADLMLRASLILNPASIVLFSSKNSHHIKANVAVAGNVVLDSPARRLFHILHKRLHFYIDPHE